MFAGLPGTGLGGLFYALLILLMPLRELWLRGRQGRWRFIARQWTLLAGILLGLALEAWLLARLLGPVAAMEDARLGGNALVAADHVIPALALAPLVTLTAVVLGVHAARLTLRVSGRQQRGRLAEARGEG